LNAMIEDKLALIEENHALGMKNRALTEENRALTEGKQDSNTEIWSLRQNVSRYRACYDLWEPEVTYEQPLYRA
ncbi:hypothetical protein BGW39_009729, partial [Mortierella sp. 14UC]